MGVIQGDTGSSDYSRYVDSAGLSSHVIGPCSMHFNKRISSLSDGWLSDPLPCPLEQVICWGLYQVNPRAANTTYPHKPL